MQYSIHKYLQDKLMKKYYKEITNDSKLDERVKPAGQDLSLQNTKSNSVLKLQ